MWSLFMLHTLQAGIFLVVTKIAYQVFQNLYKSPLNAFPGPKLYALTSLPFDIAGMRGTQHKLLTALHNKYGPIVRVRPNELSYIDGSIWKDAFTIRPGHEEWEKGDIIHPVNGVRGIIGSLRKQHRRYRRTLAHAFSKQGLKSQEPIISQHVDGMVSGIAERCGDGLIDLSTWLSWTTTDIIGDLAFGDSFGCVDSAAGHHFMESTLNLLKPSLWLGVLGRWGLGGLALAAMPKAMVTTLQVNAEYVYEKLRERVQLGKERGDFLDRVLKYGILEETQLGKEQVDVGFSMEELHSTASDIVFAGSETTATVLSGVIFNLLLHPAAHERVVAEIRSAFATDDDISVTSTETGSLPYLDAVLQEGLRVYHPAPLFAGRVAPAGGDTVAGVYLPAGTRVSCPIGVAALSEYNFAQADRFVPERWLKVKGDVAEKAEFQGDNRGNMFQPFSYGPRNCIGMNLAQAEMHFILAKILWNFDLRQPEGDGVARREWESWMAIQKVWFTWQKGPLMVDVGR